MSQMQEAWFYEEFGPLDVLKRGDYPVPKVSPNQILVEVHAAALNSVDIKRRKGTFREVLTEYRDCEFPAVPGCDMCGKVKEVGSEVTKFKVGDEVYGAIQNFKTMQPKQCGTLAQYTAVEEILVTHKPQNLSVVEAASLPLALLTAQAAFDTVKFQEGQSAFIVGGAGGVGSLAVQLAKHVYKARMIGASCSTEEVEVLRSLGVNNVVDYTNQSYGQICQDFDFIIDTIGERTRESMKSYVVAKEEVSVIDLVTHKEECKMVSTYSKNLERLHSYIEAGELKAVIDTKSPYAFSDVLEAFKHLESGKAIGKIVISPINSLNLTLV